MIGKIHTIFLTISLSLLIALLVLNLTGKKAVEEVITESWKALVPDVFKSEEKEDKNTSNWFEDLMNQEEVSKITEEIKEITNYEETKNNIDSELGNIKEELNKHIDEFIKAQEDKLSPEQKMTLNIIRIITNAKLKHYIILGIIINIILIMLSTWSLYKWIKSTSYSLIISGGVLIAISYYLKNFIEGIINSSNITLHAITSPAILLIISGIIIRFIYYVVLRINKINKKDLRKEKENEVS